MSKKLVLRGFIGVVIAGVAIWAIVPLFIDKEVSESAPERTTVITTPPYD